MRKCRSLVITSGAETTLGRMDRSICVVAMLPRAYVVRSHHDGRNQLVDFRFPMPQSCVTREGEGISDLCQPPEKLGPHPNKASCPWIKMALFGTIALKRWWKPSQQCQCAGRTGWRAITTAPDFRGRGDQPPGSHKHPGAVYTSPSHAGEAIARSGRTIEQPMFARTAQLACWARLNRRPGRQAG